MTLFVTSRCFRHGDVFQTLPLGKFDVWYCFSNNTVLFPQRASRVICSAREVTCLYRIMQQ